MTERWESFHEAGRKVGALWRADGARRAPHASALPVARLDADVPRVVRAEPRTVPLTGSAAARMISAHAVGVATHLARSHFPDRSGLNSRVPPVGFARAKAHSVNDQQERAMSENPYQPTQPQQSTPGQYGSYGAGGHAPAAPPAYGYDATPQEANSAATLSLVFGILAVVLFPIVFGPLAVWQARKAERLGKPATAGKVLGWIGIVLAVIGIVIAVFLLIAMVVGAGSYSGF